MTKSLRASGPDVPDVPSVSDVSDVPDVIEQGGGRPRRRPVQDEPDEADRGPPWRNWLPDTTRRRISLLLAFAVGAVAATAGWYRWEHAADTRAARSAVALVAWVNYSGIAEADGRQGLEAFIGLHNSGPLPVQIEDLEVVQPGLRPRDWLPTGLRIEAGKTGIVSVRAYVRCERANESVPPVLLVRARPASGDVQERRLELLDTGELQGLAGGVCGALASTGLDLAVNYVGDATVKGTGRSVRLRAPVSIAPFQPRPFHITLIGVASSTPALEITADGLPVNVDSEPVTVRLTWRVTDCAAARDLDAPQFTEVNLTGRRGGVEGELTAPSDLGSELLLELVRFVDAACR